MALFAWRFQADVTRGNVDPEVTVFVGPERAVMDDKGDPTAETFIEQSTADPVTCRLSELGALLAATTVTRSPKKI
jgi:hypothetical protein